MPTTSTAAFLSLFLATLMLRAAAPATAAPAEELVDRIVAVVDDDPIFLSDIERVLALGLMKIEAPGDPQAVRRQVLDGLIDERLRLHTVDRFDALQVSVEDVDRQLAAVRERFDDENTFMALLARLGLDEDGLRHLLTRQLQVVAYIEERLRPRIFVDASDVRDYYDNELPAELASRGLERPPLDEVRDPIRVLLTERRLNAAVEDWTEGLRLAADIVDHFERPGGELPPVVKHFEKNEE